MAAKGVVVTRANEATPTIGDLFAGKSFLVTQRVPMRNNFLERIRANGGRIVRLESQADYIIADHIRPDCPPGSLSYTFIEDAVHRGALPDLDHHRAGRAPGTLRVVGSSAPPKATRTAFTPQDDRDLWTWVLNCQRQGIQSVKGYEVYKQLESVNPRHTFQSWRDRYLKKLVHNPPQGFALPGNNAAQPGAATTRRPELDGAANGDQTLDGANGDGNQEEEGMEDDVGHDGPADQTDNSNYKFLMENIEDILNVPEEDKHIMWDSLADEEATSHLTAEQWKVLYEDKVLPAYHAKQKAARRMRASPMKRKARPSTPELSKPTEEMTTPEMVAAMKARAAEDPQASPSLAPKRKRETLTPRGDVGQKRAKAGHADAPANEEAEPEQVTPVAQQDQDSQPPNQEEISKIARSMMTALTEEKKNQLRTNVMRSMSIEQRQQTVATKKDPLVGWVYHKAKAEVLSRRKSAQENGSPSQQNMQTSNPQEVIDPIGNNRNSDQNTNGVGKDAPDDEPLQTSELNRAAKAQLIAETGLQDSEAEQISSQIPREVKSDSDLPTPAEANIVDSGIDAAAERTSMDLNDASPKEAHKDASSDKAQDMQQANAISPSNSQSQAEAEAVEATIPAQGLQLTEENLASQQAAHGVKLTRGTDLRENDENLDDYAAYLRKLVDGHVTKRQMQAQAEATRNEAEPESELESDRELSPDAQQPVTVPQNEDGVVADPQDIDMDVDGGVPLDWSAADPTAAGDIPSHTAPASNHQALPAHGMEDDAMVADSSQVNSNEGGGSEMQIDLTLAEPEGGFDFSSQEEAPGHQLPSQLPWEPQPQHDDEELEEAPARAFNANALDTQAIYDAGAQQPDFSIPLPPDFDNDESEPDLPTDPVMKPRSAQKPTPRPAASSRKQNNPTSSKQPAAPQYQEDPEPESSESITEFLARLTAKGCRPESVQNALYRTSAQLEAAEIVAMHEKLGLAVPDIPEVWSAEDDANVGTTNARVFKELVEKKGWDEYDFRLSFLQDYKAG